MTKDELNAIYFQGLEAQDANDFERAMQLFLRGVAHGDDAPMNVIGTLYRVGEGVEQDKVKAIEWFKKSYRAGRQSLCCCNIAYTYTELGNRRQAIHWLRKAVSLGDRNACLDLAKLLMKSPQVLDLLQVAADSEESLEITGEGKEQAAYLLAILNE